MDAARWQQVQEVFHAAADRPEATRRAYVESACEGDPDLLADVLAMLAADAGPAILLDGSLGDAASRVIERSFSSPPTHLGPYRLERLLGEGGMGVVYLGRRDDLGSVAAVKILRDAWLSPARRERFAAEQRTLAQLVHPRIAQLHDAGSLPDGTPWIVMEYVDGEPLTAYCMAHKCGIAERLRLFRDTCAAVQYAHGQAVIHRDLKPSNIFVTADGTVKLLDFGIAKHLEGLDAAVDQTRTGLRLLTPAYAAPEQIRGGRVGLQADVYALGVILYELLTDRLPYDLDGRTPAEVERLVEEHEPVRPSAVARAVEERSGGTRRSLGRDGWDDLDVLCLTAMHKDTERRYGTVEALARDVDHFLREEPLEARADGVPYRIGKFVRRHRAAVLAGAFALATLVAVVGVYTWRLASARNAALAQAARAQRVERFMVSLFQGGDEAVGPADSLRVLTLLDRGMEEARQLDREPATQAQLLQTLGELYQKLGNFGRADTLLGEALARRRSALGAEHPDVANSLVALGLLHVDRAEYPEAERLIHQGLDLSRRTRPPDHPDVARATAALGRVLLERGAYDSAIVVQEQGVRLHGDSLSADLATALAELANSHFFAGHYDTADSLNRRVLVMRRTLYGDRHPLVAENLADLGATRFDRGEYAQAEAFYRQALDIMQGWYGPQHPRTAATLSKLGQSLVFQDRFDEASELLREALEIRERVFGPDHPLVAATLNEMGNSAVKNGRLDEAEAAYARMVQIYRTAYDDRHYLIGTATSNLANVFMERKQYARAEELFREAVRRFTETQGPSHLNTGIARIKLGRSLLRQRRFAEGAAESLAGYEVLTPQASPSVSYLRAARRDLIADYDTLGQPEKAARFRAEIADTASKR
jgi:tetratricopeptide (TPR) repeat protein/predicted Ser/Thr protein kinase